MPLVSNILVSENTIQVIVTQSIKRNFLDSGESQAIYKLDSDLNFQDAGYSVDHEELHARLKIMGRWIIPTIAWKSCSSSLCCAGMARALSRSTLPRVLRRRAAAREAKEFRLPQDAKKFLPRKKLLRKFGKSLSASLEVPAARVPLSQKLLLRARGAARTFLFAGLRAVAGVSIAELQRARRKILRDLRTRRHFLRPCKWKRSCAEDANELTNGHSTQPIVLTIAGFDPCGGAGIAADLKTIAAHNCYGVAAVTALTVQSTQGVKSVHLTPATMLRAQIKWLLEDVRVKEIKIGMLGSKPNAQAVAEILEQRKFAHVVLDPVARAQSGGAPLLDPSALKFLTDDLMKRATVVTPNIAEAELLTGMEIKDVAAMKVAAEKLLARGARAVVIKGGQRPLTCSPTAPNWKRSAETR